jgi:glycosidase
MDKKPSWLAKACFYEIYPQSFLDTNGDGIGDLAGIIRKLDYIKGLGFNALWINPLYASTFLDAGYDVSDYEKVARRYGNNAIAEELLKEAHARGIHVLFDLVPGHTSLEHAWFKASSMAKPNEYSDRYLWTDSVWKSPKDLPVIRGFSERDGSCITNFFSFQPALNWGYTEIENPAYEEPVSGKGPQKTIQAMEEVIRFWLSRGVDGFRCDMAGWLVKRDPDSVGTMEVWKEIFADIRKDYPEAAFVSEWDAPEKSLACGFDMDFLLQDEFNPYNSLLTRNAHPYFSGRDPLGDPKAYLDHFLTLYEGAEKNGHYLSLISGNHDTYRIRKWLTEDELKLYYAFLLTMPNVPFFYYGDEIGMGYEEGLTSVEGGYQRTGSRSPMQWDTSYQAGFTKSPYPYIRVNPERKGISVAEEEKDASSLLNTLRELLAVKKEEKALDNDASFKVLSAEEGKSLLAYEREKDGDRVIVLFNPKGEEVSLTLEKEDYQNLFALGKGYQKGNLFTLAPHSCFVLKA